MLRLPSLSCWRHQALLKNTSVSIRLYGVRLHPKFSSSLTVWDCFIAIKQVKLQCSQPSGARRRAPGRVFCGSVLPSFLSLNINVQSRSLRGQRTLKPIEIYLCESYLYRHVWHYDTASFHHFTSLSWYGNVNHKLFIQVDSLEYYFAKLHQWQ
jgi:hypothetical protein